MRKPKQSAGAIRSAFTKSSHFGVAPAQMLLNVPKSYRLPFMGFSDTPMSFNPRENCSDKFMVCRCKGAADCFAMAKECARRGYDTSYCTPRECICYRTPPRFRGF